MKPVSRVRCVLAREHRYLLAQHNSRRPEKVGQWGLPGGRLEKPEEPKAGLRRELAEELRLRVPYLVEVGDWRHRGHTQRVFGCEIAGLVEWFEVSEILGIGWFSYEEVRSLAEAGRLRRSFEFEAIGVFRRRIRLLGNSVERRSGKRYRREAESPTGGDKLRERPLPSFSVSNPDRLDVFDK